MIFYLTAATYAEATAMYPEAGGSSSFARHAFNEFWSFFAAWGQMLDYVITIAIRPSSCRTTSVAVLGAAAALAGGHRGEHRGRRARGDQRVGVKEAARLNILLAVTDFATQLLLVLLGPVLVFSPETLIDNVHLGSRRAGRTSSSRSPSR